jgi:hypothetical protein
MHDTKQRHLLCVGHAMYAQVDGATVVWDLKKQRPVITLKDPNRCVGITVTVARVGVAWSGTT